MLTYIGLSGYLVCAYMFMFKTDSLVRVMIIVGSSVSMGLIVYNLTGFSWYFLLFIIVYVGGVYILFIYISMVMPNSSFSGYSFSYCGGFIFFMTVGLLVANFGGGDYLVENSHYLCNDSEGLLYFFLCLMLLNGMSMLSLMSSLWGGWLR